jgi:hypothetical protein
MTAATHIAGHPKNSAASTMPPPLAIIATR